MGDFQLADWGIIGRSSRERKSSRDPSPPEPRGRDKIPARRSAAFPMIEVARQILRHRALLWTLTTRELKARYRGSVLGYLWSLVNPLLLLIVYTFVFSVVFEPRVQGADPYALFVISGLFPWIWLSSSLLEGAASLSANAGLLRKAVFPVELLPTIPVLANLCHLLFAIPIIAGGLILGRALGFSVGGWGALALPLIVVIELPLLVGASLALAALTVHFKDIRDLLANLLSLFFFLTPILYRVDALGDYSWVQRAIHANPATPFAIAYQRALFEGQFPSLGLWVHMVAVSLIIWGLGSWLFHRLRETLVEAA
jgi:lipopolysaccharide transport system permease protein